MTISKKKWFGLGVVFFLMSLRAGMPEAGAALKPGEFYASGPHGIKRIALTFDDGPGPESEKFLDLLHRYQVRATFFMLGELVPYHPETVKRVASDGHEIGSHTFNHVNYNARYKKILKEVLARGGTESDAISQAESELLLDMKKSDGLIKKASGQNLYLCRMPNGIDRPWIKEVAKDMGYTLINWTYGADWNKGSVEDLLPGYLQAIKPGTIFLLHDGGRNRSKSLALTEAVIKAAQQQGYEFVTITQLLDGK